MPHVSCPQAVAPSNTEESSQCTCGRALKHSTRACANVTLGSEQSCCGCCCCPGAVHISESWTFRAAEAPAHLPQMVLLGAASAQHQLADLGLGLAVRAHSRRAHASQWRRSAGHGMWSAKEFGQGFGRTVEVSASLNVRSTGVIQLDNARKAIRVLKWVDVRSAPRMVQVGSCQVASESRQVIAQVHLCCWTGSSDKGHAYLKAATNQPQC